jgi:hypothetical protein
VKHALLDVTVSSKRPPIPNGRTSDKKPEYYQFGNLGKVKRTRHGTQETLYIPSIEHGTHVLRSPYVDRKRYRPPDSKH